MRAQSGQGARSATAVMGDALLCRCLAGLPPPAADLGPLDEDDDEPSSLDGAPAQDSSPGSGDQLEKQLRQTRAQLSRFSEINPDEYARLQDAERKREEFERPPAQRGQPASGAQRSTRGSCECRP